MRFIISIILALTSLVGFSQENDSATFKFRNVRVGLDSYGVIRDLVNPNRSGLELTGEFDFKKYIFVVDVGQSSFDLDSLPRYKYSNSGSFFRIGSDINFIHKDADQSVVSIGLRYGRAFFTDHLEYEYDDPVLGKYPAQIRDNDQGKAGWFELNVSMKARIWKNFWMGYRAGFKFGLRTKFQQFEPFQIPGYGPAETNTESDTYWGFNYYLMIGL